MAVTGANPTSRVDVFVVVPPGSRRPEPLLAALAAAHPDWVAFPVWAADPQLRPALAAGRWLDVDVDEGDLLRVDADGVPWLVATTALAARSDDAGEGRPSSQHAAVVLVCGVAVLGDVSSLVPAEGEIVVVPRLLDPPDQPRRHPAMDALAEEGAVSDSVAAFGVGTQAAITWLHDRLIVPSRLEFGVPAARLLELAAGYFPSRTCDDPRIGASVWRWPDTRAHLLDLPHHDQATPWLADATLDGPPRVSLGTAERLAAVAEAAEQLAGSTEPLRLPGGIEIDKPLRRIARDHTALPHRPWSDASEFRAWLHARYWTDLHRERPDLQHVFPHPTGLDADRFGAWARRAAVDGDAPVMIDPSVLRSTSSVTRTGQRLDGVNLVGYFKHQSGVSNVGRRVAGILDRQGVPYTTVAYERTWSPPIVPEPVTDQRIEFANSLAFVNGDQFNHLRNDIPEMFGDGQQVIGMWSWELETIDGATPVGHQHVDQIWGTTTFMADPFRGLGVPVHHVHVPFTEPTSSGRARSTFPPLADADDRFVFGVVLDHLSITERKNPVAAIRAFRHAFEPDSTGAGPMLVVKTINAATCWADHERLLVEAAGREDIVIWDELLPIADHVALIGAFDALVSLHRSEGVGLHLAEAMWLERPIIATNYSGNLDFMDERSAILIDADMVPVGPGLAPYPAAATWAEPRVADAADAMRRLAADPDLCRRYGQAARAAMLAMPGETEFVERLVDLLDLQR
jgi:glycosyltransferase involved in cell wall biosynthesis